MAKSLKQVLDQITKLQQQADEIRSKEVSEVVQRIRVAIDHYGLSARDLFGPEGRRTRKVAAAPKGRAAAKHSGVAKYASGDGRTWTGVGKRPTWLVEALAAGKTTQDLLIDPSATSTSDTATAQRAKKSTASTAAGAGGKRRNAARGAEEGGLPKALDVSPSGRSTKSSKLSKSRKASKAPGAPKYHDGAGKTWTGVGKRPNWFVEALAAGRRAEDLLIPAAAA
ncbi:H-NS family nucleoid-associated regulatory protein [Roseateles chitinivorans]|uniref:H-NS histone family protein n=1 Tax=Roseateles chitinivorans TaxID=2917965 RepID=UPI003D67D0BB